MGETVGDDELTVREVERIPVMQRVLDNPFLLLFIGVVVPAVSYTIWGIMEVAQIPVGN